VAGAVGQDLEDHEVAPSGEPQQANPTGVNIPNNK
jgi:hypothetical protein